MSDLYDSALRYFSFGDALRENKRSRPQRLAVVDGPQRLTFPQLDSRVNRLSSALAGLGLGEGDRVCWLGQNSAKLLECLLACAKLGAIFCPANWRSSAKELAWILEDLDPKLVFWQEAEIGETAAQARAAHSGRAHWLNSEGNGGESYEGLLSTGADQDDERPIDPNLPLVAIYTSAFSGRPHAALLSHQAFLLQSLILGRAQSIEETSAFLCSGPLFHMGTLMTAMTCLHQGAANVIVTRPDAQTMLQLIQDERCTHGFIMPPTLEEMRKLNADGRYDLSSMFAGPTAPDYVMPLVMPAGAPFMRAPLGYGQTEVTGMVTMACIGGEAAGKPILGQVRIWDEDGREAPTGEAGEIVVRGPLLMNGYFNSAATNQQRAQGGWHRTHDLGKRNADGSLSFIGPKTAMIKSASENIYPVEVENVIRQLDGVAEVCVIGVPDERWSQNVKAVVVKAADGAVTEADIIAHCRAQLASYKKPKSVAFTDALPKSGGQLDRKAVDAAFGGGGYPKAGEG